ncbi:MAG: hypothetical protein IKA61_04225 [Clostridia bacterium]|nr:hypothetical protein [Clostridia bacterium]
MSKLFKILITLAVICLSCTSVFACGGFAEDESTVDSESQPVTESVSEEISVEESEEESELETESNFVVELPEVDRM